MSNPYDSRKDRDEESLRRERAEWDRRHFERAMDQVRKNQRDPDSNYLYQVGPGGVFTSATYGAGAEYYSITGMYENPLLARRGRPKDDRIHEEIRHRLEEHPSIDAHQIDVSVAKGKVTLTGTVTDLREGQLVEELVEGVRGVKKVRNYLKPAREEAA